MLRAWVCWSTRWRCMFYVRLLSASATNSDNRIICNACRPRYTRSRLIFLIVIYYRERKKCDWLALWENQIRPAFTLLARLSKDSFPAGRIYFFLRFIFYSQLTEAKMSHKSQVSKETIGTHNTARACWHLEHRYARAHKHNAKENTGRWYRVRCTAWMHLRGRGSRWSTHANLAMAFVLYFFLPARRGGELFIFGMKPNEKSWPRATRASITPPYVRILPVLCWRCHREHFIRVHARGANRLHRAFNTVLLYKYLRTE